jgi:hypothetical protein
MSGPRSEADEIREMDERVEEETEGMTDEEFDEWLEDNYGDRELTEREEELLGHLKDDDE